MTKHAGLSVTTHAGCVAALRHPALRQSLYDEAAVLMERVVVNLHGDEHRARRTEEARVFRKDVFLDYERRILPRVLDETIAPARAAGRADLVDLGYRILMNLTVDFTGIDRPLRSPEETGALLHLMREFSLAPALGQSRLADVAPLKARIVDAIEAFDAGFFTPSLDRRSGSDGEPGDVLAALVGAGPRLAMTREEMLKESVFFVLAGAHTSIHSLTHAVHELFGWLGDNPARADRLQVEPFFVQRCVFESVRLHPSSPVARRRALAEVTLGEGVAAEGEEVVVDLSAANRDRAVWGGDADMFDPERALPPGQFPYGLSMGHGMHACLGRNLAIGVVPRDGADPADHQYGTVPLILAALLRHGLRPNPDAAPEADTSSTRVTWARYPVVFDPERALL